MFMFFEFSVIGLGYRRVGFRDRMRQGNCCTILPQIESRSNDFMKHCPTCQAEYDEDVIRFCTKDGTPLVEDSEPVFTDNLPSETSEPPQTPVDEDDDGAKTVIRRKAPANPSGTEPLTPADVPQSENAGEDSQRIVISTAEESKDQGVRSKPAAKRRHREHRQSNTVIVVLLSVIATMLVMLGAFGVYWFLTSGSDTDDANLAVNENVDLNENIDTNFNLDDLNFNINSNANSNFNLNSNTNFNLSTPTPTPSPSPSPSPSPTESPSPSPGNTNANVNGVTATPSPTPAPTVVVTPFPPSPKPSPTANTNTTVNLGNINSRALRLPTPAYPNAARAARAAGRVIVSVTLDPSGNVVSARAVSGHPLLRSSAEAAARRSKFRPASVNGRPVNAKGTINYNFIP